MMRNEFMQILNHGISWMPEPDRTEALRYYIEYFEEAGPEKEAEVVETLGDPAQIATRLMAEYAYTQTQNPQPTPQQQKKSVKHIGLLVAGICAAPIAIPLAIAIAAVIFSVVVAILSVALAFFVAAIAMVIAGVVAFVYSIFQLSVSVPYGVLCIGLSLVVLAIGLLMGILAYLVVGGLVPAIAKGVGNLFRRVSGGRQA